MNKPYRVLQVFHGMDCGGAENMIMNLYRNIDKEKIQFDFLVHTDKKCFFDDEINELGGVIYRVPYFNGINYVQYRRAVKNFFSEHREFEVVHGHLGSCANIYLREAKRLGCFTIAHSHNTKPKLTLKSIVYRINTFRVRKVADFFIGCGEAAGRYRFGNRIVDKSGRYATLKNAIYTEKFIYDEHVRKEIREQYGVKDEMVLGHVGRFSTQKNHAFLLDIFQTFHQRFPNSKLMLIGDGELKGEIQEKVKINSLEGDVIFTGVRNNVHELLQALDCFVFPSFFEGLPVTVIESQAAGLPCVISDTITREVSITDLVKYISINESSEEWSSCIAKMIYENQRQNRKKEIMDAGYDIESTTQWIEDLYMNKGVK